MLFFYGLFVQCHNRVTGFDIGLCAHVCIGQVHGATRAGGEQIRIVLILDLSRFLRADFLGMRIILNAEGSAKPQQLLF